MKSFEQKVKSNSQEQGSNKVEAQITSAEIERRRQKINETINKVRLLPESWRGKDEKTRDQMIEILENSLQEIEQITPNEESAPVIEMARPISEVEKNNISSISKKVEENKRIDDNTKTYLTIGETHIPVCQPPKDNPQWNAVPGTVIVSGGKKFSEVRFVKDTGGLTHTAKPGELMSFSEKHRGKRLESVDTVLEGRYELKAFNEALVKLGELTRSYQELNPDSQEYDMEAKKLAAEIEKFTNSEELAKLLELQGSKIEDVEDFAERVAEIIKTQQYLRSIDESLSEFIPARDSHFKLTPYFERKFTWFASLVNRQLGLGNNAYLDELVRDKKAPEWEKLSAKGMTVIVGQRGTGKNKLADFYCSETNRPLFRYACSPDKEERDLTYDVELSDGEVVRIPTRILTAVTTPNAVLELDELNLLRPNVAKFFNSLFDGDRSVFLNDQVIKAAPGVVFVGLMNPAEYDGVEDLPETIDDRSNIMVMNYPPFREIDV
ncbi:AAA family ATPase, partial [Candidatus Falkowbacteria bacterium]|nr:AAA family ATPase [Candidatus Falkowbacteria bacterium]